MADDKEKKDEKTVEVPEKMLAEIQEQMSKFERDLENERSMRVGLEEQLANAGGSVVGEAKLREKTTFEPKFRTIRLRKYPIAGDVNDQGFVIGWTNRGAYQEVDKSGVNAVIVDYIDILFLDHDKTAAGKVKAEKVKLLDLLNRGEQVHCKVIDSKDEKIKQPTGEEIDVSVFDPQHGMTATGEKVDGFVTYSNIQYLVQVPGRAEPVWIDALYCN